MRGTSGTRPGRVQPLNGRSLRTLSLRTEPVRNRSEGPEGDSGRHVKEYFRSKSFLVTIRSNRSWKEETM